MSDSTHQEVMSNLKIHNDITKNKINEKQVNLKKPQNITKDHITAKDPRPPRHFLYLRETKSWWCEEGGEGEKVSMLTHATARAWIKLKGAT